MKHAPSPWAVINDGDHLDIHYADYTQRREFTIASHVGGRHSTELEANARLIAAAPELLEALSNLTKAAARIVEDDSSPTLVHMRELNRCRQLACELLCKAEGREP